MKWWMGIIFIGLLVGCSTELTFTDHVNSWHAPPSYQAYQTSANYGGAAANGSLISSYSKMFTVTNENIEETDPNLLTAKDVIDLVSFKSFESKTLPLDENVYCYLYQRWGIEASVICFQINTPVYFHNLQSKNDSSRAELIWKMNSYDFTTHDVCTPQDGIFCNIYVNALYHNEDACSAVRTFAQYCEQVKVKLLLMGNLK